MDVADLVYEQARSLMELRPISAFDEQTSEHELADGLTALGDRDRVLWAATNWWAKAKPGLQGITFTDT